MGWNKGEKVVRREVLTDAECSAMAGGVAEEKRAAGVDPDAWDHGSGTGAGGEAYARVRDAFAPDGSRALCGWQAGGDPHRFAEAFRDACDVWAETVQAREDAELQAMWNARR